MKAPLSACGILMILSAPALVLAAEPKLFDVEVLKNVAYYDGKDADAKRHRLDMYLPKGCKDYPVVLFVHGGGWILGDKNHLGIYNRVGRALAGHGIGMVSTNYRLSPAVKHPEHVRDVARAFAWVHKNIGKHGGRPSELFVAGHSAGGHLVALLSTDETYLKAQGLTLKDVKGAIPISGVYSIPKDVLFDIPFGKDPEVRKSASPLNRIGPGAPPFLILYAESELPGCDGKRAEAFCAALKDKKCLATSCECLKRNHLTIMKNAGGDTDPVFQAILSFVTTQVALDRIGAGHGDGLDCMQQSLARYAANAGLKPR